MAVRGGKRTQNHANFSLRDKDIEEKGDIVGITLPTTKQWVENCAADGEFMLAARYWNGGLTLVIGDQEHTLPVSAGMPDASANPQDGVIKLKADAGVWEKILAPVPERFHNDIMANVMQGRTGLEKQA